jgi:hypothetical protein
MFYMVYSAKYDMYWSKYTGWRAFPYLATMFKASEAKPSVLKKARHDASFIRLSEVQNNASV